MHLRSRQSTRSDASIRQIVHAATRPGPDPGPPASPLRFKTPVDAPWRLPARQRAARRLPLQSPSGFPEDSPRAPDRGPPTPGWEAGGEAPPPRAPGWHRGRCHLGLAPGAVLTAVLPRGRSMETNGTGRRVLGPVPGRHRAAGLPPLQAQAGARRGLARPGPRAAPGRRHYLASVVFPEPGRPRRR